MKVKESNDTDSKVKRRLEQLDELDTQHKGGKKETTMEVRSSIGIILTTLSHYIHYTASTLAPSIHISHSLFTFIH